MQNLSIKIIFMQNPLQVKIEKFQEEQNLSVDAKQLLQILDELQDFTAQLRKKLMSELKPESQKNNQS